MARIVLILAVIHSLFLLSHARYSIEPHGESISSSKTLSSNETNSTLLDVKESDGVELINLTWEEDTTDSAVIDQDRHGDEGPPLDDIPISPGEAMAWVSKEEEGEGKEQMEVKNKKVEDSDSDTDSDDDSDSEDSDSDTDSDDDLDSDDEEDYKKKEKEMERKKYKEKKKGKGGFVKWFLNLVNRF